MIQELEALNSTETELMLDAVPLVTVLIAGADGKIDTKELSWSAKITEIRSYSYHDSLRPYYTKVGENFSEKVQALIEQFPNEVEQRNAAISSQLEGLNTIFPKLDPNFARRFYKSLLSFAEHVAKASGGFLRFGNVSKVEKDLLGLPMIEEPLLPDAEEEVES
ncbi:MAG: hypothetical protein AAFP19_10505 [Bacteroidota bacterium]